MKNKKKIETQKVNWFLESIGSFFLLGERTLEFNKTDLGIETRA